jgi:ribosomal protein S24E
LKSDGEGGEKQKKNPCKQKGFEKKYMHQTKCLKCEKTYFLKKHTYTADRQPGKKKQI